MRRIAALLLLLQLSCTLHPRYERPSIDTPAAWRTPLDTQNGAEIAWWQQFQDPVLNQLIDQALVQNQDLKAAVARVDQFNAQLGVARSALYPQIEADVGATRQKVSTATTFVPPGTSPVSNTFGLILNASYLVDLWGAVRSSVETAYHQWLASIEARRTVVLTLVSSVASTYIQLRQLDQQLVIAQNTWQARKESLYLARVRFELGLTSEIEVEQAISEMENAMVQVETFQILIAQTENLLSVLIGVPSTQIARGTLLDAIPMPPAIPADLPSSLVNQRPDVIAAEERLIAANANIGVAKAQFFPQISLVGGYGVQNTLLGSLFTSPSTLWDYGTSILQEIFTGGRLTSGVLLSEAQQREALHLYLSTILNAFKEVNDALVAHKIYLEQVETQTKRVQADTLYLHLSDLRYKEGQIDYLTFLDAERQLFRSQLDFEDTKGNSFLSLIQIYQALGGPWVVEADKQAK